jgi:hypothetical protein
VLLFGGAAARVIALHLATSGTLGFHTDELYYLDCGVYVRRLGGSLRLQGIALLTGVAASSCSVRTGSSTP